MKRVLWLAMFGFGFLAYALNSGDAGAQDKPMAELDGMKAPVPADWKEEKPANRMRFLQFRLPRAKDDTMDGELVVFKGFGGSSDANIKRWKEQFLPPDGKTLDEASKVTEIMIGKNKAYYLDVAGTYKYKDAPFDPKAKTELRPNQRMLAVHYEGKDDQFHIKLVGPAKTVEQHKKGFDDWLKNLK